MEKYKKIILFIKVVIVFLFSVSCSNVWATGLYKWQVKTKDKVGEWSGWSNEGFFVGLENRPLYRWRAKTKSSCLYKWWVKTKDKAGEWSERSNDGYFLGSCPLIEGNQWSEWSEYGYFQGEKPLTPLGEFEIKILTPLNCHNIGIEWEKSTNAQGYRIFRAKETEGNYIEIENIFADDPSYCNPDIESCSFTDTSGIEENTAYFYYLQAYRESETKNNKDGARKITTPFCAPEEATVRSSGCGGILIEWKKTPGIVGFNLHRSFLQERNYETIATTHPHLHCIGKKKSVCHHFIQGQEFDEEEGKSGCKNEKCVFFDRNIIPRVDYYYKISFLSEGGNLESPVSDSSIKIQSFCFRGPRWRER